MDPRTRKLYPQPTPAIHNKTCPLGPLNLLPLREFEVSPRSKPAAPTASWGPTPARQDKRLHRATNQSSPVVSPISAPPRPAPQKKKISAPPRFPTRLAPFAPPVSPPPAGGDRRRRMAAAGAAPRVGLLYDDRMCAHATPDGEKHPENPERLRAIWRKLAADGVASRYALPATL